ncbi:MAG: hypothetical protein H6609_17840 [Ignavibacteriales bacterium]|nr:hypothetical protein [Ignavibacteriales bacterium]
MKIKNCPNCNSPRIATIQYGYPRFSKELEQDLADGKIVFGGCCVTDNDPDYKCLDCNALIFSKSGKFTLYAEDD